MNLGDRIKEYEKAYNFKLTPNSCLFIRVDGRAFHTFTRGMDKPFDDKLIRSMVNAAKRCAKEMAGFKLAYIQSDEATFLLTDFDTHETQGWFNYELNKIVSITASMFTAFFNEEMGTRNAMFDSRAFIVPNGDVPNVFIWRQRDWERNSIQMFSRSLYSHKELIGKNTSDMHEMLHEKGENWANLQDMYKNGTFILEDGTEDHRKLNYEQIRNLIKVLCEG